MLIRYFQAYISGQRTDSFFVRDRPTSPENPGF